MTLNEWMTKTGTTAAELAALVGCERSWISHLRNGKKTPSLKVMDLIAIHTDGQVGRSDWATPITPSEAELPVRPAQPAGEQPART